MKLKKPLLNALVAEIAKLDEDTSSKVSEELNAGAIRRVVSLFFDGYAELKVEEQMAVVEHLVKVTGQQVKLASEPY